MNILAELRQRLRHALESVCDDPDAWCGLVKPAQDPKFGDYQANCAMPLAKRLGANPRELAAKIVAALDIADVCDVPEIAGPGFINLRLRPDFLEREANRVCSDERLGVPAATNPKRIVVDFSAPNVAKPMHVGHLRSTVIGDALYRILGFLGHHVVGDNHVGDWGTQFGMIIFGYKHFLDQAAFARNSVAELARLYRLVNQLSDYHDLREALPAQRAEQARRRDQLQAAEAAPPPADKPALDARKKELKRLHADLAALAEEITAAERKLAAVEADAALAAVAAAHPTIASAAREETARLHAGDPGNLALWRQFIAPCLAAIQTMYDRLEIHFDMTQGESFYQPFLAEVVAELSNRGIARESDGAVCVFVPGATAPFIIRKSDGAFTYATTDLATIAWRVRELRADTILYVVDARQADHFKLLFATAELWGYRDVELRHISFGTILGDDKRPFKTRSGDVVGLESLLDQAVVEARRVVDDGASEDTGESGTAFDAASRDRIAEVVGLGAVKYADLSQNRESDYVFSWEKMLAKTGDTATYMQYACARVGGIFRKAGVERGDVRRQAGAIRLTNPPERELARQLLRYSEALEQAAAEYRPNFLTQYLFDTANCFSRFFESRECAVLKAETEDLRTSRLLLCDLTARILSHGLSLLGIHTLDRM